MSLAEYQEVLKEVSESGQQVLAQVRKKPPAPSTQAAMLLLVEEAQAVLADLRRELQQTLVESLDGQRGEHTLKDVTVTVTMKSARRKFDDHGVLEAIKQHIIDSAEDRLSESTRVALDNLAWSVERAAYVGYWRTTALREFDVDVDEVSSADAGVPTVSVSRASDGG